jgi:hypothetical protein
MWLHMLPNAWGAVKVRVMLPAARRFDEALSPKYNGIAGNGRQDVGVNAVVH